MKEHNVQPNPIGLGDYIISGITEHCDVGNRDVVTLCVLVNFEMVTHITVVADGKQAYTSDTVYCVNKSY